MAMVCSSQFNSLLTGDIALLAGVVAIAGIMIVILAYMYSMIISNPKVSLWAKTEIFQIVASVATIFILGMIISGFCSLKTSDLTALTDLPSSSSSVDIYQGAKNYLANATAFAHESVKINRYYLEAFSNMELRSVWDCDMGCLFGSSGQGSSPDAGYSSLASAYNMALNTSFFAFFSGMNYLFILEFVYSGLPLFFLPIGIFLRSMPYLRQLGALLIAVVFSFMLVYPVILAMFGLVPEFTKSQISGFDPSSYDESKVTDVSWDAVIVDSGSIADEFFEDDTNFKVAEPLAFTGQAFFVAVFLPTVAMLSALASTIYLSRMMGQEIDLSRVIQMV